jgi:hypothetical protein
MSNINIGKSHSVKNRIGFIKDLLKNKTLEPLIDFENDDTEQFIHGIRDDNESGQSYDTSVVLKKKHLNFSSTIEQIGGRLTYIKSGTSGHTFRGEVVNGNDIIDYAVKVVAYPKKSKYGDITDTRRPENAELVMIKLLSYFITKKLTNHIVLPIGTFNTDIKTFSNLISTNIVSKDNEKYNEFVTKYENKEYHDSVSILISEWANRGDLLDYIRKNRKQFTDSHWKAIFFQFLSVLAVIQNKYPAFRHNDLKANNVLIHKITSQKPYFTYKINKSVYKVENIGYMIKLWDFDFACIAGVVENKKLEPSKWTKGINVGNKQNRYYDIHYFFNTLIKRGFCPQIMKSKKVSQDVKDFINRVVPKKYQKCGTEYVAEKGRILINDEYKTADEILKYDPYFEEYRVNSTNKKKHEQQKPIKNKLDMSKFLVNDNDNVNKNNSHKKTDKKVLDITKFLTFSSEKNNKRKKNRSRTISDELKELDPNILLNSSS